MLHLIFAVTCFVGGWLLFSYYDYLSRLELQLFKVNCHSHWCFLLVIDADVNMRGIVHFIVARRYSGGKGGIEGCQPVLLCGWGW